MTIKALWRQLVDTMYGQRLGTIHSGQSGRRRYILYVPTRYRAHAPRPLVVMLHGCTQNPEDFAFGTAMNQVADLSKLSA